jgi:hypothetical protein
MVKVVFLLFLLSFHFQIFSQTEKDSLFYFDYFFNYSSKVSAWKTYKLVENDSVIIFKSIYSDTSNKWKERIYDNYQKSTNKQFIIYRYLADNIDSLPGVFPISVEIVENSNGVFKLNLYSKELNINKTVFSTILFPICPINKTITYHPNGKVAKISYHETGIDSLWNARGELLIDYNTDTLNFNLIDDGSNVVLDIEPIILDGKKSIFSTDLFQFISQNTKFPVEVNNSNLIGRIFIQFMVTSYGEIEQIQVLRGIHPYVDNAYVDALKKIKFKSPGIKNDKPFNYRCITNSFFHVQ